MPPPLLISRRSAAYCTHCRYVKTVIVESNIKSNMACGSVPPFPPWLRAAPGRSWAVAVCVAIKYVVYCITLDRTCTDTLNRPRARHARSLGRFHWISVYTLTKDPTRVSHRLICADVRMQSLCPQTARVSLAGRNYPPMSVTRACLAPARSGRPRSGVALL